MHKHTAARSIGQVSIRFGEGGGQLDCRRAKDVRICCMREPWAQIGRFLSVKPLSDHSPSFFLREPTRGGERARLLGRF